MSKITKNLKKTCHGVRMDNSWAMDFDYLDKLQCNDLLFLSKFCQYYYHGNPGMAKLRLNKQRVKESYRLRDAQRRDALNQKDTEYIELIVTYDVNDMRDFNDILNDNSDEETYE